MTNPITFTKLSGSGNDFIFIDNRDGVVPDDQASTLTRSLCRHRLSVGADGIVLISRAPSDQDVSYQWRYINADGSDGEMCGNAAMCSARYALEAGIAPAHHRFLTASGVVEAWAEAGSQAVTIAMPNTGPVGDPVVLDIDGLTLEATAIQVGVPHAVIKVRDADAFADDATFDAIGRAIRQHPAFAPSGTNVNVISDLGQGRWRMRTYERGVERETLACGTGVVATSVALAVFGLATSPVAVQVSSGGLLTAEFTLDGRRGTNVRLHGSAAFIYDGVLRSGALAQDSSQKTRRNSAES